MGLACSPELIVPSLWMEDLFGDIVLDNEEQMQAVLQIYTSQMDDVMEMKIKLPAKCVLSKTDFKSSLSPESALPSWCLGMIKSLNFIDVQLLSARHKDDLLVIKETLTAFTSIKNAKHIFSKQNDDYELAGHRMKRLLTTLIADFIHEMRFAGEDEGAQEEESKVDEQAFREITQIIMHQSDDNACRLLEEMISFQAAQLGPDFEKNNLGQMWLNPEIRPYMVLRARRAQINFEKGLIDPAIKELQELIELNPNDNQANRYPLVNYLIIKQRWSEVEGLLNLYEERSTFMLAAQALMLFAQSGDSKESKQIKRQLKKSNKHLEKYLTGQSKIPKQVPQAYQSGDKSEALTYINLAGKETWRAVDGALFWLRRK